MRLLLKNSNHANFTALSLVRLVRERIAKRDIVKLEWSHRHYGQRRKLRLQTGYRSGSEMFLTTHRLFEVAVIDCLPCVTLNQVVPKVAWPITGSKRFASTSVLTSLRQFWGSVQDEKSQTR